MIEKGQWREFGQDTEVHTLLFTKCAMGFLMTTESQDLGLVSHLRKTVLYDSIVSPSLHWGVRTHTEPPPASLTKHLFQQQPSFPRRSPIQVLTRLNPAQLQWATGLGLQGDMAVAIRGGYTWLCDANSVLRSYIAQETK